MKDWSELEDRYQDLHATDAKGAEEFKHKMTNRYEWRDPSILFDVCLVSFYSRLRLDLSDSRNWSNRWKMRM